MEGNRNLPSQGRKRLHSQGWKLNVPREMMTGLACPASQQLCRIYIQAIVYCIYQICHIILIIVHCKAGEAMQCLSILRKQVTKHH
jgi:hypothetical protein